MRGGTGGRVDAVALESLMEVRTAADRRRGNSVFCKGANDLSAPIRSDRRAPGSPTKAETAPAIGAGKKVRIAAHGNSLRALVKYLDNVPDDEIIELNIPTGIPLVYVLNDDLQPLQKFYLGDPETVQKATAAVANQGKARS